MKHLLIIMLTLLSTSGFSQFIIYNSGYIFGSAPTGSTGSDDLQIIGGTCTITSSGAVHDVVLVSGTALVINSGITLTVNGKLDGSGSITVQQGGQLVQTGLSVNTHTGTASISVAASGGGNAFRFVSTPISAATLPGQFPGSNPCDMFVLDASSQEWGWDMAAGNQVCDGTQVTFDAGNTISGADGEMDIARGYTVSGPSNPTFSGTFNNGIHSISVSTTGISNPSWSGTSWNFIGNPYPSAVNASSFVGSNGAINGGTIYFWDDPGTGGGYNDINDYASWNSSGGVPSNSGVVPNGSIPVGQGFFIEARTSGTVTFRNSMRGGDNSQFFKTQSAPIKRVWLNAVNASGYKSYILLAFTDSATQNLDDLYDGKRFIQNQTLLFGTQINQEGCYVIQGQDLLDANDRTLDVMLRVTESNVVSISLDHFENFYDNKEVYFVDTETGKSQNLHASPFAVYLQANQNYDGRFKIVIKDAGPNGVAELDMPAIKPIIANQQLRVDFNGGQFNDLRIIDVNGAVIRSANVTGKNMYTTHTAPFASGVYFIQVTDTQGRVQTKKVGMY